MPTNKAIQHDSFRSPTEFRLFALGHMGRRQAFRNNSRGNGIYMQHGNDHLLYLRTEQQLRINVENRRGTRLIEAWVDRDGTFTMVLVITEAGVTKATGAAEIKALPCYGELHQLWMVAIKKRLMS